MNRIRILPEILSNKIAAGEVVERPASVVKELVENALDAGSTRITIDIEKGGRSLIRVSDDGSGMSQDDALLSIERYATSKIYRQEDLFAIKTLGFRGEALPSIASVSRFSLVTRERTSNVGTEIRIEGGRIVQVSEIGAPIGTMVTVRQLFFNTPARRKFLKQIATEMGHIADVVSSMALGHPQVQFKLIHNGRILKNWIRGVAPIERVSDVMGQDLQQKLYPVSYADDYLALEGWIASPDATRATSRNIYIFINGRIVRDRVVQHALFEGYAGRIMKGQVPVAVLFLMVPHDTLDVNVHPTKSEVRFAHQKKVHEALRLAVAEALKREDTIKWGRTDRYEALPGPIRNGHRLSSLDDADAVVAERTAGFQPEPDFRRAMEPERKLPADSSSPMNAGVPAVGKIMRRQSLDAAGGPISEGQAALFPADGVRAAQSEIWRKERFADLKVIGQYQDIYIICEAGEDLVLIDQHAAHERIVYEHLKRARGSKVESQGMLMPEVMELGYREAKVLDNMLPELAKLGFKIEHFGGESYLIQSAPALFKGGEIKPIIREIVEKWIETGSDLTQHAMDDTLKVMACHGAVRASQRLTALEMETLLKQLDACEMPSNCPHGRPTWIKLSRRFIEKSFKRVV